VKVEISMFFKTDSSREDKNTLHDLNPLQKDNEYKFLLAYLTDNSGTFSEWPT
jgi:hypothetical protein